MKAVYVCNGGLRITKPEQMKEIILSKESWYTVFEPGEKARDKEDVLFLFGTETEMKKFKSDLTGGRPVDSGKLGWHDPWEKTAWVKSRDGVNFKATDLEGVIVKTLVALLPPLEQSVLK